VSFGSALKHAWNVFSNQGDVYNDRLVPRADNYGPGYSYAPDSVRIRVHNERSIIGSIYTRVAVDVSSVDMRHVRTDEQGRYLDDIDSGLNNCLVLESNLDQAATAMRRDLVLTLFDRGCAAVVPVDTTINPDLSGGYDILTLRVGEIVQWYPEHVRVSLYNEKTATRQEITLKKSMVAIVENPLYAIMNEPNSTLQRLLHKLHLLDVVDEASASRKLDLIIQVPYVIRSESLRQRAEQRRSDIEFQLKNSEHGIAYTDGTEKVVQLNRPIESNLMGQIEFLSKMLYGQLGITEEIMNGTADEKAMINYWNRTIEPVLTAIVEEMRRKFLTKTARTQHQSVLFFKNLFRIIPIANLAEIVDKFTRNEIATANEMRQVLGLAPHKDPKADLLTNSNMPVKDQVPNQGGNGNGNGSVDKAGVTDLVKNLIDNQTAQN
jgi:putative sterol carrier protein